MGSAGAMAMHVARRSASAMTVRGEAARPWIGTGPRPTEGDDRSQSLPLPPPRERKVAGSPAGSLDANSPVLKPAEAVAHRGPAVLGSRERGLGCSDRVGRVSAFLDPGRAVVASILDGMINRRILWDEAKDLLDLGCRRRGSRRRL